MQDGTPLGRYRLLELMGHGEMGETWRAYDTVAQRDVAVTVLPTQDVGTALPQGQFRQETVPITLPGDPAHTPHYGVVMEYPLYWPNGPAPGDPTHHQPAHDETNPPAPKKSQKSRKLRLIGLASAAVIAIAAAAVAAVVHFGIGRHGGTAQASSANGSPAALANTGPFTGTFNVRMGAALLGSGKPDTSNEARAYTDIWRLRSACGGNGCVATALAGDHYDVTNLVFDNVGGRWLSVAISQIQCGSTAYEEAWNVVMLVPQPDGSMSGEATRASVDGCFTRRTATLTRTGDADIAQLPDPGRVDPRVASPAEALHGRYDVQTTYANGHKVSRNYGVQTDCLHTGDRCMSFFIAADGTRAAYVFANGVWTLNESYNSACSSGGKQPAIYTETIVLPQPPQDPIMSLLAHGYESVTPVPGVRCPSQAYDDTFTRTGD